MKTISTNITNGPTDSTSSLSGIDVFYESKVLLGGYLKALYMFANSASEMDVSAVKAPIILLPIPPSRLLVRKGTIYLGTLYHTIRGFKVLSEEYMLGKTMMLTRMPYNYFTDLTLSFISYIYSFSRSF